ncbi:DNA (cytosine-5-)-methyltransferase [Mycoplasmatota bacterium]|nr:DNA (cytosine-5-)-methyltransferase [Mycoplasmatota bacterium]
MKKIKLATVFSGIGSPEFALRRLNIPHESIFACDNGNRMIQYDEDSIKKQLNTFETIDEKIEFVENVYKNSTRKTNFVQQSYLANYGENTKYFFQDIKFIDGKDFINKIDLFIGGSPCQSFSTVGHGLGLDDARGTLFYDFARLVKEIKPKVFIYENVRGLYTHDKKNTWDIITGIFENSLSEYTISHTILNSLDYGIPQNRRRIFVVGVLGNKKYKFPSPIPLKFNLNDFRIENCSLGNFSSNKKGDIIIRRIPGKVDSKYTLSPSVKKYVMSSGTKSFYIKPKIDLEIARPILATMGNKHRAGVDNYFSLGNGDIRMLTENEALRLMGFTDDFKVVVSKNQMYHQAGNSIVVDVMMAMIKELKIQELI